MVDPLNLYAPEVKYDNYQLQVEKLEKQILISGS